MLLRSLGRRTDLMFAKFSGSVTDRGSYILIKTPSNPHYHWGNYLVFDHPPRKGSHQDWTQIFDREFEYYSEPHHYVFTWQGEGGDFQEFLDAGFTLDTATVLTATKLNPPPHLNQKIEIRKISSDTEWAQVTRLQVLCSDPKFMDIQYEQFKTTQMNSYRKMSEAGHGFWFGAYIEGELVGDLGIFFDGKLGRYQNVGTHPDRRRQGICGTLVYKAGEIAFKEFGIEHLVMEADVDYHAARIYESVGFQRNEINKALSWWKSQ